MDKKILFVFAGLLVFVVAVNLMTQSYVAGIKNAPAPVPETLKDVMKEEKKDVPAASGVSEAPSGVVVVKRFNRPATQGEWDAYIEQVAAQSKMFETEEGLQAIKKMSISPAQFEDTVKRIEDESRKVEEAYARDPNDPLLRQQLQDLYKAKAVTNILVKKGVVDPSAPQMPGMNSPQGVVVDR